MNHRKALTVMSALSQPARLSAVNALTRPGTSGMNVNDLAAVVGILQNSMSVHLAVLARAGLVRGTKIGRETIYRANGAVLKEFASFAAELASDASSNLPSSGGAS
jgi:ArsR family transcriptional regulator, arsenate/arsenite/antimonite-responsive transcriptional repressor